MFRKLRKEFSEQLCDKVSFTVFDSEDDKFSFFFRKQSKQFVRNQNNDKIFVQVFDYVGEIRLDRIVAKYKSGNTKFYMNTKRRRQLSQSMKKFSEIFRIEKITTIVLMSQKNLQKSNLIDF